MVPAPLGAGELALVHLGLLGHLRLGLADELAKLGEIHAEDLPASPVPGIGDLLRREEARLEVRPGSELGRHDRSSRVSFSRWAIQIVSARAIARR